MLSEKIYQFRRKNGLSQEQLAEKIGVSRQAVSKWESGTATPELDKLLALSQCFGIPLDELVKEETVSQSAKEGPQKAEGPAGSAAAKAGVILCLAGAVCLVLSGVMMVASPGAAEQLNAASTVTLNGTGVMLIFCVLLMAAGLMLVLRKK